MSAHPWTPWNPTVAPPLRADVTRVYCLTHAGGGARAYLPWARLPEAGGLEICPVELPGHGVRIGEPALRTLDAIADAVFDALFASGQRTPFALFGHSMGALVAHALAQRIERRGLAPPVALLVSAARPPGLRAPRAHGAPSDEELLGTLSAAGGTRDEVLACRELMQLVLPALRADFEALAGYEPAPTALRCAVRAYGGSADELAGPEWIERWSGVTSGTFSSRIFPGDHFYTSAHPRALVRDIAAHAGTGRLAALGHEPADRARMALPGRAQCADASRRDIAPTWREPCRQTR
jgi:surfactin synthase thioesterase subunit